MYEFYGYCNDLLVKLNVEDLIVVDVPTPIRYEDETSHISYRTYVPRVSGMLLQNFLWRLKEKYVIREFHPLALLYSLGFVGMILSLLQTLRAILSPEGRNDISGETLNTGLTSCLLLAVAMACDREKNKHLDRQLKTDDCGRNYPPESIVEDESR